MGSTSLREDALKDTFFQLWYPDDKTDEHLYREPAHFESGIAEAPIDLPPTTEEMRSIMVRTRIESPVKDLITSSASKIGIGWLDFIACRHFRTPPDPTVWQRYVGVTQKKTPTPMTHPLDTAKLPPSTLDCRIKPAMTVYERS